MRATCRDTVDGARSGIRATVGVLGRGGRRRPGQRRADGPAGGGCAGRGRLRAFAADVTAPVEVENAFAAVDDDPGAVTLAVACAGMAGLLGPLHLADPEAWWRAVEVDLRGSMLTARSAVGRMVRARAGRLVMVYGNLGDWLGAHVSAFAAAKAGVARLTEVLACRGARGVPGWLDVRPRVGSGADLLSRCPTVRWTSSCPAVRWRCWSTCRDVEPTSTPSLISAGWVARLLASTRVTPRRWSVSTGAWSGRGRGPTPPWRGFRCRPR